MKFYLIALFYIVVFHPELVCLAKNTEINEAEKVAAVKYSSNAIININEGQWDLAFSNFNKCLLLDPKNAQANEGCGFAYVAKRDLESAIFYYSRAIQLEPTNALIYLNRGNVYRAKHEYDKALSDFDKCLKLGKTNDMVFKSRAAAYVSRKEYDKAIADFSRGLELFSEDAVSLLCRADVYFKTQQYDKALADYHKAISIAPENPDVYNDFAWFRATCAVDALRNGKEAVKMAMKACELTNWEKWQYIDTLGAAWAESGDFDKAIIYEKQALLIKGITQSALNIIQNHIVIFQHQQVCREK